MLHLHKGGNATYRSHPSTSEFLSLIGRNIGETTGLELNASPYLSFMIDEITNLSTSKQLIVYACYLVRPTNEDGMPLGGVPVWTRYIGLQELSHAEADSVTKVLLSLLEERYKLMEPDLKKKLAGFSSDGANVMMGEHAGVRAKLKEIVPGLISVDCSAHKLALAAAESATQVS